MTKPTEFTREARPAKNTATVGGVIIGPTPGGGIGVIGGEPPDPVEIDRADGSTATIPRPPVLDPIVVQSAQGQAGTGALTVTLAATPTPGNLLLVYLWARNGSVAALGPSGFTQDASLESSVSGGGIHLWVGRRVVESGDPATVTTPDPGTLARRMAVVEVAGVLEPTDVDTAILTDGTYGADHSISPTGTGAVFGCFLTSTDQSDRLTHITSTILEEGWADGANGPYGSVGWAAAAPLTAHSDNTAFQNVAYVAGNYPGVDTETSWVAAPNVIDGVDATYAFVYGEQEATLRLVLDAAYALARARLHIGIEDAGSVTYDLQAGDLADFSDATTVASFVFTATGSFTPQDVEVEWTPTGSFRYWQLVGPAENRNIHSLALFEAVVAVISDHGALTGLGDDDHPQYAEDADLAATDAVVLDHLTRHGWKYPVRVASTADGTLASAFESGDTVDGVVLATGDRILLKDQTAGAENGIYVVAASGAPTRATDMDIAAEVLGAAVYVIAGTANGGKAFFCTNTATVTLGTTALTFVALSGGSALTVEEPDASPTDAAVTKLVFPEGSVSIASHVATIRQVPAGAIGCSLIASANQTVNNGKVLYDTELKDTDGLHSVASNTSRITIPAGMGGPWSFVASVYDTTGAYDVRFYVNGAQATLWDQESSAAAGGRSLSGIAWLDAGDYVEVDVYTGGAGHTILGQSGGFASSFACVKLDSGKVGSGIGVRAVKTASQSLTDSTETVITFPATDLFDSDQFHDPGGANPSRVTIPAGLGGKFAGKVLLVYDVHATGVRDIGYKINGGTAFYIAQCPNAGGAAGTYLPATFDVELAAGDYIEIVGWQNSGGALNVLSGFFSLMRWDSGNGPSEWQSWTATVTQSGAVTITAQECRYIKDGPITHVTGWIDLGGAGTTNNAIVIGGMPAALQGPAAPAGAALGRYVGTGKLVRGGVYFKSVDIFAASATDWRMVFYDDYGWAGAAGGANAAFALSSNDEIYFQGVVRTG